MKANSKNTDIFQINIDKTQAEITKCQKDIDEIIDRYAGSGYELVCSKWVMISKLRNALHEYESGRMINQQYRSEYAICWFFQYMSNIKQEMVLREILSYQDPNVENFYINVQIKELKDGRRKIENQLKIAHVSVRKASCLGDVTFECVYEHNEGFKVYEETITSDEISNLVIKSHINKDGTWTW